MMTPRHNSALALCAAGGPAAIPVRPMGTMAQLLKLGRPDFRETLTAMAKGVNYRRALIAARACLRRGKLS
jgi:hypothetical protein